MFSILKLSKKLILIVTDRTHFIVTELYLPLSKCVFVHLVRWGTVCLCASCAPSDCASVRQKQEWVNRVGSEPSFELSKVMV